MYKNKRIMVIIPARSGSKGIPNKNIVKILGRPLIDYTISESLKSSYIDSVYVSTDSQKISEIAVKCGAQVPFLRPKRLAEDNSKTIDCVVHFMKELYSRGKSYDYLVLLQPTSPLRNVKHIDEAIATTVDNDFTSLVTVKPSEVNPIFIRTLSNNGHLESIINVSSSIRRQDLSQYYQVHGAIYINKTKDITPETSFNDNEFAYLLGPPYSLDIDTYEDLEQFRNYLKKLNLE